MRTAVTSTSLEYAADAEEGAAAAAGVDVSVLPGPSHLEANVPPTLGKARMKLRLLDDLRPARLGERVLCFLVRVRSRLSSRLHCDGDV